MADFLTDYVNGVSGLMEFYSGPPGSLLRQPPAGAPWAPELCRALADFQMEMGSAGAFEGDEPVVVTGQQPAIFTGPLYTVIKAATAVLLAKTVSERTGAACVPVFWVGSEDHDFEEARTTHFLTKNHESMTVRYAPSEDIEDFPMHRVPLDASLHGLVNEAVARTPGSEQREPVARFLRDSLDASESLAEWSTRIVARLFRETPLVVFAPHLTAARALSRPVLEQEIQQPLESTALLNEAGNRLERLGYPAQVTKGENECNFFLLFGNRRRKVTFEKGLFHVAGENESFSTDLLLDLLQVSPERFSPNVALRCIVQQQLFPTAAYVAGPGELAYWAQLKPLFEHFGKPMPVVYPRARCALTTLKLNKLRAKLGIALSDLANGKDALVEQALRNTTTNSAYRCARRERQHIEKALGQLADGLQSHDKTAASMAENLAAEVASKLDRLERSIVHSDAARADAAARQVERLCNSLAPSRKPQERHYNIFSFLFEHGWDLVPRLLDEIDVESFEMQEIEL